MAHMIVCVMTNIPLKQLLTDVEVMYTEASYAPFRIT